MSSRPISADPQDLFADQPDRRRAAFLAAHAYATQRLSARIRGEAAAIRWGLLAVYCACHGLIFGGPSTGKTTFITTMGNVWGGTSRYLRGTNDAMASDLTGADLPNVTNEKWWHVAGPLVGVNFLLTDEINRYSAGALTALLDAQQESVITSTGGYRWELATPFVVLGALNPRDRGTTPLSKANDDRFGLAFRMGPALMARDAREMSTTRDATTRSGESRMRLVGGISDTDLAERIRVGAPVNWRDESKAVGAAGPYTPAMLAQIQRIIVHDIAVDLDLDLAIAQLWRMTCEVGEVEIGLRAPEVHRAVVQAYAATDPKTPRGWVTDADVRATWRAVYCGRLQDPTYTDAIAKLEDKLFGDGIGVFRFPKSATNTDSVRYPPSTGGRR